MLTAMEISPRRNGNGSDLRISTSAVTAADSQINQNKRLNGAAIIHVIKSEI